MALRGRARTRIDLDQKVAALRSATTYPERIRYVEAIETHFAWVFLAGRYAYKLKKPVRQAAMDYRRLAARERGCREELRLNRRFAPNAYLGVVPLTVRNGSLVIGAGGPVVDWLVKMRRLSPEGMLDHTLRHRALSRTELDRLCSRLVHALGTGTDRTGGVRRAIAARGAGESASPSRTGNARLRRARECGVKGSTRVHRASR